MSHVTYATQVLSCMYFNSKYDLNAYQVLCLSQVVYFAYAYPNHYCLTMSITVQKSEYHIVCE